MVCQLHGIADYLLGTNWFLTATYLHIAISFSFE